MKIISWNINGMNSAISKGLPDFMAKEGADAYCFQEVKSSLKKVEKHQEKLKDYHNFYLFGKKDGYSGVSIHSKTKPISVINGISNEKFDDEGRVLTFEFPHFFLINAYFPHSQRELKRLDFKISFNEAFLAFCKKLEKKKPVVIASDFNVAHKEIDLKNPKQNEENAGFTKQERAWFDSFLKQGFIDTFREFTKEGGHYTWWTWRANARARNIGWRIDYFVISEILRSKLKNSKILKDTAGSDHCPISLEME